jgi:dipeptidyl aminopeptidase/acylaminoacyl peptidase
MNTNRKLDISGTPCLQVTPSRQSGGTVLLYHGWGSNIDKYEFFASTIAHWGYNVIVPELPLHGVRGKLDYTDTHALQQHFWQVVLQITEEAVGIIAKQDSPKLAIVGHSTGGVAAARIFALTPRMNAAVVINGACDWVQFEQSYRNVKKLDEMSADVRRFLDQYNPMPHFTFGLDQGLLNLHGTADETVPIDSQIEFMEFMQHRQIPPEQCQLLKHNNVNHHITIGMMQQTKDWLDRFIGG